MHSKATNVSKQKGWEKKTQYVHVSFHFLLGLNMPPILVVFWTQIKTV